MKPIYEIEIYETVSLKRPFSEWLEGLRDIQARAKIRVRIDRLKLGNLGKCESVGNGVFELKLDFGPGYRIYFAHSGKKIVLLLCGGSKRTQKRDIEFAKLFLEDFERRGKQ